jgi:hypothetical protein
MGRFIKKLLILILGCNVVSFLVSLPFFWYLGEKDITLFFCIVGLICVCTLVYFIFAVIDLIKKYL